MEERKEFYKGKKVLVTGATGFLGSWLHLVLQRFPCEVHGIARSQAEHERLFEQSKPKTNNLLHFVDMTDYPSLLQGVQEIEPDIVFHLAGTTNRAHARNFPASNIYNNCSGLMNLLEALRRLKRRNVSVLIAGSAGEEFDQNRVNLFAKDAYITSKNLELLIAQTFHHLFTEEKGAYVKVLQLCNSVVGGDIASGRLMPSLANTLQAGENLTLTSPNTKRRWYHALESVGALLYLAHTDVGFHKSAPFRYEFLNFSDKVHPVAEVKNIVTEIWNREKFDVEQNACFPVKPLEISFEQSLSWSVEWYKAWYGQQDMWIVSN